VAILFLTCLICRKNRREIFEYSATEGQMNRGSMQGIGWPQTRAVAMTNAANNLTISPGSFRVANHGITPKSNRTDPQRE